MCWAAQGSALRAGIRDLCKDSLLQKEETTNVRIFLKLTKARVHPLLIPVDCKQEIPVLGETDLYLFLSCYFYLRKTILSCIPHLCFAITQMQNNVLLVLGVVFL